MEIKHYTYEELKQLEIPIGKAEYLSGQTFGQLTALFRIKNNGGAKWACQCTCGNYCAVYANNLKNLHTTSCGCTQHEYEDLTGQKFGHLTVLYRDTSPHKHSGVFWICECDCPDHSIVSVQSGCLKNGTTTGCGSWWHRYKDIIGNRYGHLVARKVVGQDANRNFLWECDCDCGNTITVPEGRLESGQTTSCGCSYEPGNTQDLIGKVYGRLTVIEKTDQRDVNGNIIWKCECGCKKHNIVYVSTNALNTGNIKSCGCLNSNGESMISSILTKANIHHKPHPRFDDCKFADTDRYAIFDFKIYGNPDYYIEYDGPQHFFFTNIGWNTEECFRKTREHDIFKNNYLFDHSIIIKRIPFIYEKELTLDMITSDEFIIKSPEDYRTYIETVLQKINQDKEEFKYLL